MAGTRDRTDEAALWRRWRSAAGLAMAEDAGPDPLLLAAYAENRLPADAAEAVENWLVANPEAADDVLAARRAARELLPEAPLGVAGRAAALVAEGDARVVAFRRPVPRVAGWRTAVAWGGIAASLLVTSLVGFTLGSDAYVSLARREPTTIAHDLLDPPSGLFQSLGEEPSI